LPFCPPPLSADCQVGNSVLTRPASGPEQLASTASSASTWNNHFPAPVTGTQVAHLLCIAPPTRRPERRCPLDINRLTEKAQQAILAAQTLATRNGQTTFDTEHLLLALLEQESGLAPAILAKAHINADALRQRAALEVQKLPRVSGDTGQPHPGSR